MLLSTSTALPSHTPPVNLVKLSAGGQDGGLKVELRAVGAVDVDTNTVQSRLEGLLGSRVKHLVTDAGRIGVPGDKDQLGGGSAIGRGKLQVNQAVTAVVIRKTIAKVVKCLGSLALVGDLNGFLVLNLVQHVTKLLALLQLEIGKGRGDLVRYFHSSRL